MRDPSGDHVGSNSSAFERVRRRACVPFASAVQTSWVSEENTIRPCRLPGSIGAPRADAALAPARAHPGVAFAECGWLALGDRRHRMRLPSPLDRDLTALPREPDDRIPGAVHAVRPVRSRTVPGA